MQNHLTRLKQLTVTESSRQKTRMLEMALSQSESERKELEARIEILEQRTEECQVFDAFTSDPSRSSPDLQAVIESLRLRYENITEELRNLKDEHATLRLVKRNETDKLYEVTALLNEKENELDMIKRQYAHLQFELDEMYDLVKLVN
jgi:chromosome segregation ATPase